MGGLDREDRPAGVRTTPTGAPNGIGNGHANGNGKRGRAAVLTGTAPLVAPDRTRRPLAPRPGRRRQVRPVVIAPPAAETSVALRGRRSLVLPVAVGFVLILALLTRVAGAHTFTPQADEPASILAAHQIAERGVPILPSGTLYLHGATLSYLLTPFVWAGYGDLQDLTAMRMVSVVFGTIAVGLAFLVGRRITGVAWTGLLAAFLLAIDPISVEWGSLARMYSVLQAITLATLLMYLSLLLRRRSALFLVGFVICFWLAVFSHVGAALIWPGMTATAFAVHGRALFRTRRDLAIGLGACLLGPFTISATNALLQPTDYRPVVESSFFSFAGEGLFNVERLRSPRITAWDALFARGEMATFLPFVFVMLCGALIGGLFLQERAARAARVRGDRRRIVAVLDPGGRDRRVMTGATLAIYWGAVLAICFFTYEQKPRYLLHVHPLTYVLFAAGVALLVQQAGLATRGVGLLPMWQRWLPQTTAAVLAVLMALFVLGDGLAWRFFRPIIDTDHIAAVEYVAAQREPGDLVIAALPAPAYLQLGGDEDLMFLAGSEGTRRVARYTRMDEDGRTIDYWAGVDSIVSTSQLCSVLLAERNAWIIVDQDRLNEIWAYGGPMRETVLRMSDLVAELDGGVQIYHRYLPPDGGAFDGRTCGSHGAAPPEVPVPTTDRYRRG